MSFRIPAGFGFVEPRVSVAFAYRFCATPRARVSLIEGGLGVGERDNLCLVGLLAVALHLFVSICFDKVNALYCLPMLGLGKLSSEEIWDGSSLGGNLTPLPPAGDSLLPLNTSLFAPSTPTGSLQTSTMLPSADDSNLDVHMDMPSDYIPHHQPAAAKAAKAAAAAAEK